MFEFVRTHNRLLQVLLGLVIFPLFIFSGVQSYSKFQGPDAATVATVDGKDITKGEWDQAHRQYGERLRQQNPTLDPKLLDTAEAHRRTLDELVHDRVIQAAVFHQNLLVSDDRLMRFVASNPQLQQLMQMDAKTRKAIFEARGLTAAGFEQQIREEIAKEQVLAPVTTSQFLPPAVANRALDAVMERREVQWHVFATKDYLDKVQPTDAEVQAYYADAAHAATFRAPEEAQIEYVVLDMAALKAQVTVNEDELKTYYQQNIKTYQAPEERHASHILVKVDAKASADEKAKAKAKAEALLAEVRKNPASFAEVAKKNSDDPGSAPLGGDLDWFGHGAMTPPFEKAVFSLQPNQISDVVATDFGYHIIQLTGVRGGQAKPYEEVRPQIEDAKRREVAQTAFADAAEKFTNMVYEQSDSLQPVIDKLKLQKLTATVQREPAPGAAGPLASKRLFDAVFSAESLRSKRNTEAIESGPNQLVSARVVSSKPAHQVPLVEVKDKVLQMVRLAQAQAAAKKDGEALVAALKKDPAATLAQSGVFSRAQRGALPGQALDAALKTDASKGAVATGLVTGDGYVAMRVVKPLPRDPADAQTVQARQLVSQSLGEAESAAFFEALKARYKAKVDEKEIGVALAAAEAASAASAAGK
jgi:peptidyl-prolyl cis-trans isomerase D